MNPLADTFLEQGYVVIPNAFPFDIIDQINDEMIRIKRNPGKHFFYSQATHRVLPVTIDNHSHLSESIEGITRNPVMLRLSRLTSQLLRGDAMLNYLRSVMPKHQDFVHMNSMLFDKSTETVDHIDSWYLDTNPKGYLVGAWVALENIQSGCGPFRIYPSSHKFIDAEKLQTLKHDEFIQEIRKIALRHKNVEMLLNKGDLVLWHSCLIHGAAKIINPSLSRRSLTSHYYPYGMKRQETNTSNTQFGRLKERLFLSPHISEKESIYELQTLAQKLVESSKLFYYGLLHQLRQGHHQSVVFDMRSKSYKND